MSIKLLRKNAKNYQFIFKNKLNINNKKYIKLNYTI